MSSEKIKFGKDYSLNGDASVVFYDHPKGLIALEIEDDDSDLVNLTAEQTDKLTELLMKRAGVYFALKK